MDDKRLKFEFHTCLGKGGFGEVYLATLGRSGTREKRVAVKVLKQDLRNATEAVQRLRDEGRMLAILDHPCILRVLEMTLIEGRVALVTEYIDGVDLARCCKKGSLLPPKVVVGVLGEVASALHCAWTTQSPETGKPLKLIHRDVKPENIRIGKNGAVKLLDFGIARTTEMFRHAKTAQGDLPFTPGYAAPEAFTMGFQGSASDVYALGVTMFRLLAGERLYDGMDLADQVTIACLRERYTPFLEKRLTRVDSHHPELKALLTHMLSYEASERPSATEVDTRCEALLEKLEGPTHVQWARATQFPEPTALPNGTLTGRVLHEDNLTAMGPKGSRGVRLAPRAESSRALLNEPDATSPAPDLMPTRDPSTDVPVAGMPPIEPPAPRPAPPPSVPPPVPDDLVGLRPKTGPVRLEHHLQDPQPEPVAFNTKATLDAFVADPDAMEAANPTLEPSRPPQPRPPPLPPRPPDMPTVDFPPGLGTLALEDAPTDRTRPDKPAKRVPTAPTPLPAPPIATSTGLPMWAAVATVLAALAIGGVGLLFFLLAVILVIFG